MSDVDDSADYARRLEAKLSPARIRSTLAFVGLYQLTHEMLKRTVLEDVKGFFGFCPYPDKGAWPDKTSLAEYKSAVLALNPTREFKASLMWLRNMGAVSQAQMDQLDDIYLHRHDLTHELGKYLVDPDYEPNADLFATAIAILKDISRFWTSVEKDIGTFDDYGEISLDDIMPGYIVMLSMCIDAYMEGVADGNL